MDDNKKEALELLLKTEKKRDDLIKLMEQKFHIKRRELHIMEEEIARLRKYVPLYSDSVTCKEKNILWIRSNYYLLLIHADILAEEYKINVEKE